MDSSGEKTPRQLVEAIFAAKTEADLLALKAQIQSTRTLVSVKELVPNQVAPEPLVFDQWDDDQEPVGNRPLSEIQDCLQDGLGLSLEVLGGMEYCIRWQDGQIIFEVWNEETEHTEQPYDSLEELLKAEGARPSFKLEVFMLIG